MLLKLKSPVFIDRVIFELDQPQKCLLKAVLKDEYGIVCSALETEAEKNQLVFNWSGLNDLPYGVYTLEVSRGSDAIKTKLVKRI
ncbi:MAG: hypothetical protein JST47_03340 [Bacteroidetes bacterium]|nr:hypothetical protein [Bacteroidota bacterium]